jgi:hypothetical protein
MDVKTFLSPLSSVVSTNISRLVSEYGLVRKEGALEGGWNPYRLDSSRWYRNLAVLACPASVAGYSAFVMETNAAAY